MSELVSFRGAEIPKSEAEVLQEIERDLNREFTLVEKLKWFTKMGFSVENNRVIGIGIYKCSVNRLPKSIGNLCSLKNIFLEKNQLKTLPDSIGKLDSLRELSLANNYISSLPNSIGSLKSLKKLDLYHNKLISLPKSFRNLELLEEINLRGNPLSPKNPFRILIPLFFMLIVIEMFLILLLLILDTTGLEIFFIVSTTIINVFIQICAVKIWQISKTQKEKQMEILKELLKSKL